MFEGGQLGETDKAKIEESMIERPTDRQRESKNDRDIERESENDRDIERERKRA